MTTAAECVRRGAALLDEKLPGWDERLDLAQLDLADGDRCVLGQLYGEYSAGWRTLGLDGEDVREHGFFPRVTFADLADPTDRGFRARYESMCALLDQEWRSLVAARRMAEVPTR